MGELRDRTIGIVVALAICAGLAWTFVLAILRSAAVGAAGSLHTLRYGAPFHWATQDQSAYSPPPGTGRLAFGGPLETPTHVNVAALSADLAIWVALAIVLAVAMLRLVAAVRHR